MSIIVGLLRAIPLASFCWNMGSVETMRQRVETTTNIQDTTAAAWNIVVIKN
jgi:hypothetical protein